MPIARQGVDGGDDARNDLTSASAGHAARRPPSSSSPSGRWHRCRPARAAARCSRRPAPTAPARSDGQWPVPCWPPPGLRAVRPVPRRRRRLHRARCTRTYRRRPPAPPARCLRSPNRLRKIVCSYVVCPFRDCGLHCRPGRAGIVHCSSRRPCGRYSAVAMPAIPAVGSGQSDARFCRSAWAIVSRAIDAAQSIVTTGESIGHGGHCGVTPFSATTPPRWWRPPASP